MAHPTTTRAGRVHTDRDDGLSSVEAYQSGAFGGHFGLLVGGIGTKSTKTTNFALENDLEGLINVFKLWMILTLLILIG